MSHPSPEEIKRFVTLQNEKWNAHDKEGYLEAWKSMAPNGITFEDPVGTPPKIGWELWSQMWDTFNRSSLEQRIAFSCVSANEIALFVYHRATYAGDTTEIRDIELFAFSDGEIHVRCWWEMPSSAAHVATLERYSVAGQHDQS